MQIVFVKSIEQFKEIKDSVGFPASRYIPTMPKVSLYLAENGGVSLEKLRMPIDYLTMAEREAVFGKALELSYNWYRPFMDTVCYQGIDIADCCRIQMLSFFQDLITAEQAVQRIYQQHRPDSVVFYETPRVASFDVDVFNGRADVFEAVAQHRFKQYGVEVHLFRDSVPPDDSGAPSGPSVVETPLSTQRIGYDQLPPSQTYVAGYAGGYDLYVLWPYLKALCAGTGRAPLLISQNPELPDPGERSGLHRDPAIRFIYVNEIPCETVLPPEFETFKHFLLRALNRGNSLPPKLQNPLFGFQFEKLVDTFFGGAIKMVQRARHFFSHFSTSLFLDEYSAGHTNRAWTGVAGDAGIKTATIPHAPGVNLVEFFDFTANYALAWGELSRQNLILASPERKHRIINCGSPVYHPPKTQVKHVKRNKVLLLTGGMLHQTWTNFNTDKFIKTWDGILSMIKSRPHLNFILKPHPSVRDFGPWYQEKIRKENAGNCRLTDGAALADLLPNALLSVLIGTPGTAALISMHHRVPVVYLDTLMGRRIIGYEAWQRILHTFSTVPSLFTFIDKIIKEKEFYQEYIEENIIKASLISKSFEVDKICDGMEHLREKNNDQF